LSKLKIAAVSIMRKVLFADEMRAVDRLTTERFAIPSILLMESAARATLEVIREELGELKGKLLVVFAGPGNNGGDAAALARLCLREGAGIKFVFVGDSSKAKGDAEINFKIIRQLAVAGNQPVSGLEIVEITDADPTEGKLIFEKVRALIQQADAVIDGIFGTGLNRPPEGIFLQVVKALNSEPDEQKKGGKLLKKFAIDIPSGLDADRETVIGECFKADATITFTAPKIANVFGESRTKCGRLYIRDIGSPENLIHQQGSNIWLIEKEDAANWLKQTEFAENSYKNKRGHVFVIAGSESYSGAAALAANAAMRSGAGLVTLISPKSSLKAAAENLLPEIIINPVKETEEGTIALEAFDEIRDKILEADAVLIGCGLGRNQETQELVRRLVENIEAPVLVDADGLYAISPLTAKIHSRSRAVILTPHLGEYRRLTGRQENAQQLNSNEVNVLHEEEEVQSLAGFAKFASRSGVFLISKVERVVICEPDGRIAINTTGDSAVGKAGNGDTLAGLLSGFVAQAVKHSLPIFETLAAGVFISGRAAEIAVSKYGRRVMTASDVRDSMGEAFKEFLNVEK
jgi:NAD(P)H-hydrate epimerase